MLLDKGMSPKATLMTALYDRGVLQLIEGLYRGIKKVKVLIEEDDR